MADQFPAAQSLTQVNQEFSQARANRLDSAITKALESKLPAAPAKKGGTPAKAAPGAAAAGAPAPAASTPAPAAEEATETEAADPDAALAAIAADGLGDAADPAVVDGELGETTDAVGFDRTEVTALAAKKDLRGVEKLLGLPEGVLGATNGEYALLRRRQGEVETRAKEVEATHTQNNTTLIGKFGPVVDLIGHAQKGNLVAYAATIERTTGVPIAVFVEHWAKNTRQLPPETLELQRRLARYEAPDGRPLPAAAATEATPAAVPPAAAIAKADAYIKEEIAAHPALKLKDGAAEVRKKWLAGFDKASKAFKLTPKQAADAVIEDRRKLVENESWILSGKTPPKRKGTTTVNRTGALESQPRKENLTREQLIERGAQVIRQQKAADARRVGR